MMVGWTRGERTHHIRLKPKHQRDGRHQSAEGTQNGGTPGLTHLPTARNPENGELWSEKTRKHNIVRTLYSTPDWMKVYDWVDFYSSISSKPQSWKKQRICCHLLVRVWHNTNQSFPHLVSQKEGNHMGLGWGQNGHFWVNKSLSGVQININLRG